MVHGKISFLQQDTAPDKTVQTSEFAYSDVLDTVKEKEIRPDKPRKGSPSD